MALVVKDRVKETTTTTGTGSVTLAGASTGFQTFNSAIGTGNTTYYCIAGQGTSEWEVGLGTLSASTTLDRTTVYASSNAGSLVNFSAGTKDVFVTFPASIALRQEQYALYTSGTTTWTCPVGVTQIKVVCIGGGGGGGQPADNDGGNAGDGGMGGVAIGIYTVTPGTGYSAVVGAGGAISSSGGTSSLGSLISSTGGGGGGAATGSSPGATGANGAGSSGTTANSYVRGTSIYTFIGGAGRPNNAGTSALTWTASSAYLPGSSGAGQSLSAGTQSAGVGGIVYIEYVG